MTGLLVFVGDGLTQSGDWEEWFPEYRVHNLGKSGDTTDDVIARLDEVGALSPDAVVLQVGTNDVGWRKSDEHVVRNIETILCVLRKQLPDTRIMVQSVLPREREFANIIRSINRHLWQFAPTRHAQYLDLWPVMAQSDGELVLAYSSDYVHLTPEGYKAWMSELKPALELLLDQPPSSVAIAIPRA